MTEDVDRKLEFMRELTVLSLKHHVFIYGCGCCGSPLVEIDETREGRYMLGDASLQAELQWKENS